MFFKMSRANQFYYLLKVLGLDVCIRYVGGGGNKKEIDFLSFDYFNFFLSSVGVNY